VGCRRLILRIGGKRVIVIDSALAPVPELKERYISSLSFTKNLRLLTI